MLDNSKQTVKTPANDAIALAASQFAYRFPPLKAFHS